jgi:hypothetical protein
VLGSDRSEVLRSGLYLSRRDALDRNFCYRFEGSYAATTAHAKAKKKKVKISLLQNVEAPRVARGRGSHIT